MGNKYYEAYNKNTREQRQKQRKKERSFEEQFRLVYWCGLIGAGFIHLCSFVSAVAYPAHEFQVMYGNLYLGLLISGVLVFVFIEIPKYTFFSVYFENKFDTGTVSNWLLSMAIGLTLISAYLSPNGTKYLVEWWAGDAQIEDTQVHQDGYKEQRAEIVGLWQPKIKEQKEEYKNWYESKKHFYKNEIDPITKKLGRWRLSRARKVTAKDKEYSNSIAEMEKTLNQELSELSALKSKVVSKIIVDNDEKEKEHEAKKEHASLFSFILMLILEGVYILALAGMKYYNHRAENEHELNVPTESEQVYTEEGEQKARTEGEQLTEQGEQGERSTDKGIQKNKPSMQIPYSDERKDSNPNDIYHGLAFKEQGQRTARIWYKKEDGDFVAYTPGDIMRRMKKKEGSAETKEQLLALYNKVVNYKG